MRSLGVYIERVLREPRAGVFNLGSRDGMSKADFAFELAAALGLPTPSMSRGVSTQARLPAYRPKDMRLDCSAFEQAYAVRLPTLVEEIHSLRAGHGQ
jgi:dTDP-4-dehydrorhamnose reductase